MTIWVVRAGKFGEREKTALDNKVAVIGWEEVPDLMSCTTRGALQELLRTTYPDEKPKTLINWVSQIWPVRETITVGDLIVLPLKTRSDIVIGKVTGPYQYRSDLHDGPLHTRPVEWLKEIPRSAFDKDGDLLSSINGAMTVFRVVRNNAEQRIAAMLKGVPLTPKESSATPVDTIDVAAPPDIAQESEDRIRQRIIARFKGHALTTLIGHILHAQGYSIQASDPGPDGGVDIVAGSGPLGFDAPRLIVQVKSQESKVDVKVLRELTGVMGKFHADHALLIGWGGFTQAALKEASAEYFKLRLWDAGDVVRGVQDQYPNLPDDIKAEIPLKRVWTLVPDQESE